VICRFGDRWVKPRFRFTCRDMSKSLARGAEMALLNILRPPRALLGDQSRPATARRHRCRESGHPIISGRFGRVGSRGPDHGPSERFARGSRR
jgi:hypothetical protein